MLLWYYEVLMTTTEFCLFLDLKDDSRVPSVCEGLKIPKSFAPYEKEHFLGISDT